MSKTKKMKVEGSLEVWRSTNIIGDYPAGLSLFHRECHKDRGAAAINQKKKGLPFFDAFDRFQR